jgi:hypothetical protein
MPLTAAPYTDEAALQKLVAAHPDLVPGEQIDSGNPRRWLVVAREIALSGEDLGTPGLALDHLLLDQDGVPTLVEVKRASDTRIRREVVGQMLDYAARAGTSWTAESLRERHAGRCQAEGADPDSEIEDFLGPDGEPDRFWSEVKTNLQAGRIRLIFLADIIPPDLRRIVEFLNRQMDPAEVLAVEIRQFAGGDVQTFVPRVHGQTIANQERKSPRPSRKWDEGSFFAELQSRKGQPSVQVAREILDWAKVKASRVSWGRGAEDGSFAAVLQIRRTKHNIFAVYTYDRIEINFQSLRRKEPFSDPSLRRELLRQLGTATGIEYADDAIERRPSYSLADLARPGVLERFRAVLDLVVATIRATPMREAPES